MRVASCAVPNGALAATLASALPARFESITPRGTLCAMWSLEVRLEAGTCFLLRRMPCSSEQRPSFSTWPFSKLEECALTGLPKETRKRWEPEIRAISAAWLARNSSASRASSRFCSAKAARSAAARSMRGGGGGAGACHRSQSVREAVGEARAAASRGGEQDVSKTWARSEQNESTKREQSEQRCEQRCEQKLSRK